MPNPNRASNSLLALIFFAVILLMVLAPRAHGAGMTEGISACRALQASPLPVACKFDVVEGSPTFFFGLTASEVALSPEETSSLIWDVISLPCASKDVTIAVLATLDGVKSIRVGICSKSKLTMDDNWRPLDTTS